MKKNPFKRRKKDQKPKEEDKQLVSTEREAAATNESQGGQLQVQVPGACPAGGSGGSSTPLRSGTTANLVAV